MTDVLSGTYRNAGAAGLIERLTEAATAATAATANERPSLEHDPARLRGIVLELALANGGRVIEGTCYVERRVKPRRD